MYILRAILKKKGRERSNMLDKIIKAAKNGTLLKKIKRKIMLKLNICHVNNKIYHIKNKNIISLINQSTVYEKMEKKYADVLEKGIVENGISVKSDKVWVCWFQGEDKAPDLVRACINSIRKMYMDCDVVVLTDRNIKEYVQMPKYIIEKRKKGIISAQHYSDLLRIELLCKYGGLWLDATVLCTSSDITEGLFDLPLFVYKGMDLLRKDIMPTIASNWLIYAHSNQKILLLTRKLLHMYWQETNDIDDYYIFHIFFALSARRYIEEWNEVPMFNNCNPHTLQFELDNRFDEKRWNQILKMSDFHKLNHHNDYTKVQNSYYNHIISQYLYNEMDKGREIS